MITYAYKEYAAMGALDFFRGSRTPSLAGSWDNFARDFEQMTRDLDRFFGQLPTANGGDVDFLPACDMNETNDAYQLSMDVPGIRKDDLNVEVIGNTVRVTGERQHKQEERLGNKHRIERNYGKFSRSFTLPERVDEERIEAKYDQGVLHLTMPKAEKSKAKHIKIH